MWEQRDWESLGQFEYRHEWGETDLNAGGADDWSLQGVQEDSFETEKRRPFMRPIVMHKNAKSSLFALPSENINELTSKKADDFRAVTDVSLNTKSDSGTLGTMQSASDVSGVDVKSNAIEGSTGNQITEHIPNYGASSIYIKSSKSVIPDKAPLSLRRDRAESLDTSDFVDTQDTNPDDSSLDIESPLPFTSTSHTLSYQSILQQRVNLALRRIYFSFFPRF